MLLLVQMLYPHVSIFMPPWNISARFPLTDKFVIVKRHIFRVCSLYSIWTRAHKHSSDKNLYDIRRSITSRIQVVWDHLSHLREVSLQIDIKFFSCVIILPSTRARCMKIICYGFQRFPDLNSAEHLWINILDNTLYHHHHKNIWGNIFGMNNVHPSRRVPETCGFNVKVQRSCFRGIYAGLTHHA